MSDSDLDVKPAVSDNKKRKSEAAEESGIEGNEGKKGKEGVKTDDGIAWDLGGDKFLRVKEFKGKTFVDIREFYEDKSSGEKKPGKKGIMLNAQQWKSIMESLDQINESAQK
mmetsp:Transcript_10408/g.12644  ORF Transcript_10408/g.12644 Transcript_10408/m.12644 type:complete len:112 (+) Transcript_10408:74-409(+)